MDGGLRIADALILAKLVQMDEARAAVQGA